MGLYGVDERRQLNAVGIARQANDVEPSVFENL